MKLYYTKIITQRYVAEIDDEMKFGLEDNDLIKEAEWEEHNWSELISKQTMIVPEIREYEDSEDGWEKRVY